nr:potassium channel family protein [Arthrobacter sp. 147(2020)]
MVLQVQLIITAHVPQVSAAEAVVVSVVLFLCLFSLLYASIAVTDPASFSEELDRVDALYFTTATFATVGFGDVVPASSLARVAVTIQMIGGLGLLVMIAKVVFYAARQGLSRRP